MQDIHADKDGGSGSFLKSAREVAYIQNDLDNAMNGDGISNVFLWCQYPPSISDVDNASVSVLMMNVDMGEAYAGLDLLNNLLPPPLGLLVLLRRCNAVEIWCVMQG